MIRLMVLLQNLLDDDIVIEFEKTNGMHEEVYKEYIISLNRKLALARERIVSEGLSSQ